MSSIVITSQNTGDDTIFIVSNNSEIMSTHPNEIEAVEAAENFLKSYETFHLK